jgi:hypothetical protein
MRYLLDANVVINAHRDYYPLDRVPEFWRWLRAMAERGVMCVPFEVWEEIAEGEDDLARWLRTDEIKAALLLDEDAEVALVQRVIGEGYAPDLTDTQVQSLGRDPFLIAHALAAPAEHAIVSLERSRPSATRQNRKVPDVGRYFGIEVIDTFELLRRLDFRTSEWR